jgi:hypothetical protein
MSMSMLLLLLMRTLTHSLTAHGRIGLLASISESVAKADLSIENVHTAVRRGATGGREFVCELDCVATSYMDHDEIQAMVHNLSALKQEHNLAVCDIRMQRVTIE